MNSDEMWLLQLWSGTFGGVISAVAAAVVAVVVLIRSNNHQTELADKALKAARKQARRELRVQREEASKERGIQAIADLIAELDRGLTELQDASMTHQELAAMRANLTSTTARWQMEMKCPKMEVEIAQWPELIFVLARNLVSSGGDARHQFVTLALASGHLRDKAMDWYAASADPSQIAADLTSIRLELDPRTVSDADAKRLVDTALGLAENVNAERKNEGPS